MLINGAGLREDATCSRDEGGRGSGGARGSRRGAGVPRALPGPGSPPGSSFGTGEKNKREASDKLLKAKPQQLLKKRLATPTRKEMGKNNKNDIKMLEITNNQKKKYKSKSALQARAKLSSSHAGWEDAPGALRLLAMPGP